MPKLSKTAEHLFLGYFVFMVGCKNVPSFALFPISTSFVPGLCSFFLQKVETLVTGIKSRSDLVPVLSLCLNNTANFLMLFLGKKPAEAGRLKTESPSGSGSR